MMRRIVSPCIDDVPVPPRVHPVPPQAVGELRKPLEALVAARRPALLEQGDEEGRARGASRRELRAEPLDLGRLDVMIEVEVVEEARRLARAEAKERVHAAV